MKLTISVIILAHFKERESNLKRIIDDLSNGTVKPDKIIMFIDNSEITFNDERVTIICSSGSFLPIIRFALGSICDTDYCFFIDDDLSVQNKTLENLLHFADLLPKKILGMQGSILGKTTTPYSNDRCINRDKHLEPILVDVIIRTYFVPKELIPFGLQLRNMYPELPKESLDDVFLCLGNKYLNHGENYVIPTDNETGLVELPDAGIGQSRSGEHYKNRNLVCRFLIDKYE
jgi:hypothetical protein